MATNDTKTCRWWPFLFPVTFDDLKLKLKNLFPNVYAELFAPNEDAEHQTFMVGIWLEDALANAIAQPGGESPDKLHITLCYCGDVASHDDATIARAIAEVEAIARYSQPLRGDVRGFGVFDIDDGKAIYATPQVVGLVELRQRMYHALDACGLTPATNYDFIPHITLRYTDGEAAVAAPQFPDVLPPLRIDYITVAIGDRRTRFPLSGHTHESSIYSMCGSSGSARLFNSFDFAEPPEWVPYLPIPQDKPYQHPVYGEIAITGQRNANFVSNFNGGVYQKQIPIDAEHHTKLSGAMGWISKLRQNADGSVDAHVEWTDRGQELIKSDRFKYFSPEFYDEWTDPVSGETYTDVAVGGALTTRPFFKDKALRPLVASEGVIEINEPPTTTAAEKGETHMSDNQTVNAQAFSELQQQFSELQSELADRNATIEALQASEQRAQERANEQAEQATALAERVANMETTARRKRFGEMASDWFAPGETDHVAILETMAEAFGEDSDQFKAYVRQQGSVAEALLASNLFSTIGKANPSGDHKTASERLDIEANKIREADGELTYEQAYTEAVIRNPKLYSEYAKEGK